jgi:hypothetical protein
MNARERARASAGGAPSLLPDRLLLAIVDRFVRILARCGSTTQEIIGAVLQACERIPHGWADRARRVPREISEASHVLTVWFTEAAYLDADGKPRPLPLEGAAMSVAALVRSVDPQLDPREVLMYLLRSGAVRRRGAHYVPRKRDVLLRGLGGPDYFRTLRVLRNMLGTLEHNVQPKRRVPGRFEYFVENPHFPVSQLEQLDTFARGLGKEEVLPRIDLHMQQRAKMRRPGEPTVRVGFGFYVWQDPVNPQERVRSPSHGRRNRKSKGLTK